MREPLSTGKGVTMKLTTLTRLSRECVARHHEIETAAMMCDPQVARLRVFEGFRVLDETLHLEHVVSGRLLEEERFAANVLIALMESKLLEADACDRWAAQAGSADAKK